MVLMAPPRILLDCDPGHDDAIALVLAARHAELMGITTVAGNVSLERTTVNALAITELIAADVPVHAGAARPLLAPAHTAERVHGASGLDGAELPTPSRGPDSADAIGFLIERGRAEEGLWLVATGPLTNVALALRLAPDLARRLAGISLMGGSATHGNRSAVAEFNIWADPEAAAIVFECGARIVMSGLHLTMQLLATPARREALRVTGTRTGAVLADLLTFYARAYQSYRGFDGPAVHDACAVLALTHSYLFRGGDAHVVVETAGRHTRGMTVVDRRPLVDAPAPTALVLDQVDAEGAFDVITATAATFP
jgi:inosine-uridine nucleoside N-ribohydrolase